MSERWVASRYLVRSTDQQGNLVLYSSFTGHMAKVAPDEADLVRGALGREGVAGPLTGTLAYLQEGGFLVPAGVDEQRRAKLLHERWKGRKETQQLIILPTEACNFRCVYCYETFVRDKMDEAVQAGLRRYVERRVKGLEQLTIGWFGGEPLCALDVIESLSEAFIASCRQAGVRYSASMTTNGYLLTSTVAARLAELGVHHYQITLDGPAFTHNERRLLEGTGAGTFETIVGNLTDIARTDLKVDITVRVNFDPGNMGAVPQLLADLRERFRGDRRFSVHFHPVGKFGGAGDDQLEVCDAKEAYGLFEHAAAEGWRVQTLKTALEPCGSVCYAANPNALVIGSEGSLYKCTVALSDPRNHVGRLLPDGRLQLDDDRLSLWITSGESEDQVCQDCFFRPACQGNTCPWRRMNQGARPCPPTKNAITRVVRMVAGQR